MRVTINFPDPLFRVVKAVAARRRTSVENVILAALEAEIRKVESNTVHRVEFPVLPSSEPGTLNLSNAEIDSFLA